MEKLKPCPFCGSTNLSIGQTLFAIGNHNNIIECKDCGMYCKPAAESWDECIKLWNRRDGEGRSEHSDDGNREIR